MNNYISISDVAQSFLIEVANVENNALRPCSSHSKLDILEFCVCQTRELEERAGLQTNRVSSVLKELKTLGIATLHGSGKRLAFDESHIVEFRRQFPAKQLA